MLKEVVVEGYDNYVKALKEQEAEAVKQKVSFIVIIKSSPEEDGKNWCRDCALLDKMLEDKLKALKVTGIILKVKAGTLEQWLSDSNRFKTDETLRLEAIPTAFRWKGGKPVKRLEAPDILSPQKFKTLFEDD